MKGYKTNIEKDTLNNNNFRKISYTLNMCSCTYGHMTKEEIGEELHYENNQLFRIEGGRWKMQIIDDNEYEIKDGDANVILTGSKYNITKY